MSVTRIPVPVETRAPTGRTNAYIIDSLLVDPADRTAALDRAVDEAAIDHIAVTHTHADHVGAVAHYARTRTATVWAREGWADRFQRATGVPADRTFRGGTTVGPTTVLDAPGHAPDHVVFVSGTDALVGDLAVASGSVFVGGEDGDVRAYLIALRRLRVQGFHTLFPGHGDPIDDPRSVLDRLLAHRRDRESRVLGAVRAGARTPAEIVDEAYAKDLSGVRDLAELAVEAHLDKLAVEGKITWASERVLSHDG